MCNNACQSTSCPFAFTEESEKIQNYGCLPTPYEIIGMRLFHNKTWACHSDPTKPCAGGLDFLREHGFDARIVDRQLVTEENVTKALVTLSRSQFDIIHQQLSDARLKKAQSIPVKTVLS